jgi:HSP20 family protein
MALIRYAPARELRSLQRDVNRLFGTFFDSPTAAGYGGPRRWIPAVDVLEEEDRYILRADLPGISETDVNVELENDVLTVSGRRASEHEERKHGFYRLERASGSFSRSLRLPPGVDPESIQARFENGVLEVRVPKPEQHKPRRVAISVGEGSRATEGESKASESEAKAS